MGFILFAMVVTMRNKTSIIQNLYKTILNAPVNDVLVGGCVQTL